MNLTSEEIREEADLLLNRTLRYVFTTDETKLSTLNLNNQSDRGIDFVFEIVERLTDITRLKFNAQNKGVEQNKNIKILKSDRSGPKGYISFQLDKIRHIPYYMSEIGEPIIIFICDIEKSEVYWYSIQLDSDISKRAKKKIDEEVDSIQIYVNPENKVNGQNSERLLKDILYSKKEQNVRFNYKEEAENFLSETFKRRDEFKDNEDAILHAIGLFEPFEIVPRFLIAKQFPFSLAPDKTGYCITSTLYVTNEELLDYFLNVTKKKEKGDSLTIEEVRIIKFLNRNLIHHIESSNPNSKLRICVHDLLEDDICKCVICEFNRMNYSKVLDQIGNKQKLSSRLVDHKYTYVKYKFGLYDEVFLDLKNAISEAENHRKWAEKFLLLYNLKKLERIISFNFFGQRADQIVAEIETYNINAEFELSQHKVSSEARAVLRWIHEDRFIHRPLFNIDKFVQKLLDKVFLDDRGGWTSDSKEIELMYEFAHFMSFIEGTPVFYDKFTEFENIIHKVFEGLIVPNKIKRKDTSKHVVINGYVIDKFIRYGKADEMLRIIQNHQVTTLELASEHKERSGNEIANRIQKFAQSIPNLRTKYHYSDGKVNFHIKSEIRRIIENSLLLFSYCDFTDEEVQSVLDSSIRSFIPIEEINWQHKFFNHFIYRVGERLSRSDLDRILDLVASTPSLLNTINISLVVGLLDKKAGNVGENSALHAIIDTIVGLSTKEKRTNHLESLIEVHSYLSMERKEEVSSNILNFLSERFDSSVYYSAVVTEVIDYEPLLGEFIKRVPKSPNEASFKQLFASGSDEDFNIRVNQLIQICYKFNLEIPEEVVPQIEYYKWLSSPETYDYEKFDPLWVLEFQVKDYARKFRGIPEIRESIEKYLQRNHDRRLSNFYFNELI